MFHVTGNITPTPSKTGNPVEIEMTEFRPQQLSNGMNSYTGDGSEEVVVRRKMLNEKCQGEEKEENGNGKMVTSRTSDLTASITSNDLRNFDSPCSIYYRQPQEHEGSTGGVDGISGTDDYEEDLYSTGGSGGGGFSETDALLNSKKAARILNLTHIEDNDICFADD